MKELDKPDFRPDKTGESGVRAVQQRLRASCAGFVKGATNAGVFADLLQEQQRLVGASMNGCRPPRLPSERAGPAQYRSGGPPDLDLPRFRDHRDFLCAARLSDPRPGVARLADR